MVQAGGYIIRRCATPIGLALVILALLACSDGSETPNELSAGVISSDLGVGANRLSFFLLDTDSVPVTSLEATVSLYYPAEAPPDVPNQVIGAVFRKWPLGDRGVYTAQAEFDRAGMWFLRVSVSGPDGSFRSGQGTFEVKESSSTPAIGSQSPRTRNRTIRDVDSLEKLTTAQPPDPDLYKVSIDEALAGEKPLVVVFATPAFCSTSTCGPQVEVLTGIKDRRGDEAIYIHVEIYDNPDEIQGDLSRARLAPAVEEWGLPSEPWTFIVDRQGRVASKFEGFTTEAEIEEGLNGLLE